MIYISWYYSRGVAILESDRLYTSGELSRYTIMQPSPLYGWIIFWSQLLFIARTSGVRYKLTCSRRSVILSRLSGEPTFNVLGNLLPSEKPSIRIRLESCNKPRYYVFQLGSAQSLPFITATSRKNGDNFRSRVTFLPRRNLRRQKIRREDYGQTGGCSRWEHFSRRATERTFGKTRHADLPCKCNRSKLFLWLWICLVPIRTVGSSHRLWYSW